MFATFRAPRPTAKPPSYINASTIAIYVFAVTEAIGIAIALWNY